MPLPSFTRTLHALRWLLPAVLTCSVTLTQPPVRAQALAGDATVLDARDAYAKRNRARLAADRAAIGSHPLAPWVEYWELGNRLYEANVDEVEAFYARWRGSYVEDRLRNDWLLELGRRRDWANFARDYPRFQMNDDREVVCYALLTEHLQGKDVREPARAAWLAQRDADDGCLLLATTLYGAKVFQADDVWRIARQAAEFNRPKLARAAAALIGDRPASATAELFDQPVRWLTRKASGLGDTQHQLVTMALMRMAANDPDAAAVLMQQHWERSLPPALASSVWAVIGKQAALKLSPQAPGYYELAWQQAEQAARRAHDKLVLPAWSDDALAWSARTALRNNRGRERWLPVLQAIEAMSPPEQRDTAWVYWKARAQAGLAPAGAAGDEARAASRAALQALAGPLNFYAALAADDLGQPLALPPKPLPPTPEERDAARAHPGLQRALLLMGLGLRNEGVREWNYSLRGMSDRQLLATAQLACEREVWDRCINSSERTRAEVDIEQRYPMPFRAQLVAKAREIGIDPAYVYGLIRQESRFVTDARSSVGASGLMQVMPATARWTAQKLGLRYSADMLTDRDANLTLGTGYLKLVLDSFEGSQALAAAAYNAGPSRSRRWREGPALEPAVWAENVPFTETRDYVKKVLANAMVYAALLNPAQPITLKTRLGASIGPSAAPEPSVDLP